MKFELKTTTAVLAGIGLALSAYAQAPQPKGEEFEKLCVEVQQNSDRVSPETVIKVLDMGRELGRPYAASIAIKSYMSRQQTSQPVLRKAIENAFLVGDHRTVVARGKAYLKAATPDAAASEVAAMLYSALLDFAGAPDDAYRFMGEEGEKFRTGSAVRKYDSWYLEEARRRKDYPAVARRLRLVFSDALPLEMERLRYWDDLAWLMAEFGIPHDSKFGAIEEARQILPLIRGDERRKAFYTVCIENLAFRADTAGKDVAMVEKGFEPVLASARNYITRFPTADSLKDIITLFAEGNPDQGWRNHPAKFKQAFFVEAFQKLNDADRLTILDWTYPAWRRPLTPLLAGPEQWVDLAEKYPAVFLKSRTARDLPFVLNSNDPAVYARHSAFLKGMISPNAAVIHTLAAGLDLNAGVDRLFREESWHLADSGDVYRLLNNSIWPKYRDFIRAPDNKLAPDYYGKVLVRFGTEYVAKTPLALFDTDAAHAYILYAWRHGSTDTEDKTKMITYLKSLDWVPYTTEDRRKVFSGAYNEFKQWADGIRKQAGRQEKKGETAPAVDPAVAQISTLENAFKQAFDVKTGSPTNAPNAFCQAMAGAVLAARNKKPAEFVKAARQVYPALRDYDVKKIPLGRSLLTFLVSPGQGLDIVDFQCEVLADQLTLWNPAVDNERIQWVADAIMTSGKDWRWGSFPQKDRAASIQFNAVFEKALAAQLGKGNWQTLFDWMKATRRGQKWEDLSLNRDLFIRMINEKSFLDGSYRPAGRSAVADYMDHLRYHFSLPKEYSNASTFDDLFVEEATRTRYLDYAYWSQGGRDEKKKVRNAAARIIQEYPAVPFGWGEDKLNYPQAEFWAWQRHAFDSEPAVRDVALAKIESYYGKTRFDAHAAGVQYFLRQADISKAPGRKEFFEKLSAYLERVKESPILLSLPYLQALDRMDPKSMSDAEIDTLKKMFSLDCSPRQWSTGQYHESAALGLYNALLEKGRERELDELASHFWKLASDTGNANFQRSLTGFAEDLLKYGRYDLAAIYSSLGLDLSGARLTESLKSSLTAVRSRALTEIGGIIPVPRSDFRYPLFAAQADYFSGNSQRAWLTYLSGRSALLDTIKELDFSFLTWLVDRNTELGNFADADSLSRAMIQWMDTDSDRFSPEARARVLLSYANIAFHRPEYPRAKALYGQIAAAKEFEGLRERDSAELRIAEVDRLTGQPEEAVGRLEKLFRRPDPYVQTEAHYQMALVKADLEEYVDAKDHLNMVFSQNATHADGRILEGKINLMMKQLERATRIDKVGFSADQEYIVPGRTLRIGLEDRTLSVVGKTKAIEVRIWTDSGDEEIITLIPFADSLTRFEGEIQTALALVKKGDRLVQLLGEDRIHYDFSDRFKKDHGIRAPVTHTLYVVSDSELYASSGRILTSEEIQEQELEKMIRQKLQAQSRQKLKDSQETEALSAVRLGTQVKPGNRVNVRVVDPDRSVTPQADKISIKIFASSGDTIEAFPLTETGGYTGIFEGSIPTESAPATAYASDSDEGRDPNFVISSGNYPAWTALPDNKKPKAFSVDLNDSIILGKMNVQANVPGRKLKNFLVQVSRNGTEFESVGSWPERFEPWDGSPTVTMAPFSRRLGRGAMKTDVQTLRRGLDSVPETHKETLAVKATALSWKEDVFGKADAMGLSRDANSPDSWYLIRLSAAFYSPVRQTRTFRLEPDSKDDDTVYVLAIDNEVGRRVLPDGTAGENPLEYKGVLSKGVHILHVYTWARRQTRPGFKILQDVEEAPYMAACPPDMFDPQKNPLIRDAIYKAPAAVTASAEGGAFEIAFSPETRARAIRLVMKDYETDAPGIEKIQLTAFDGKAVLPTQADLLSLRRNQILEIVPGDQISITYTDPRSLSPDNRIKETTLAATYADAKIETSMIIGFEINADGLREPVRAQMRRFRPGDGIDVLITDPDADVSSKPDIIKFTMRTSSAPGSGLEVEALESGEHTGVFAGRIFPVPGEPTKKTEIKVTEGDDIIFEYLDRENTDPGVPWIRSTSIEQTWYQTPELRVYDVESKPAAEKTVQSAKEAPASRMNESTRSRGSEIVPVRRTLVAARPTEPGTAEKSSRMIMGGPLFVELTWPSLALSMASTAEVYVQTSSGRRAHKVTGQKAEFDVNVPGTLRITGTLETPVLPMLPPGYEGCTILGNRLAGTPLDDGCFIFNIPVGLGVLPEGPVEATEEETLELKVNGQDEIFVGFHYTNDLGEARWIVQRIELAADVFLDVMDRHYQEPLTGLYVGETAYIRVIDPKRDVSDDPDKIQVALVSKQGRRQRIELSETFGHSGIFKGVVKFNYDDGAQTLPEGDSFPVAYGDAITVEYESQPEEKVTAGLEIFKGSDGDVMAFSRRFADASTAVKTQLTVAEAFFELAKKHRALGQEDLTREEIASGKRILQEALRDYPDAEGRVQGDYLLANLALEFAKEAKDEDTARKYYMEAISLFSEIVTVHRDSEYAPKAQYKKAITLEQMGDIDTASEEYVKLSYRWPDNELVAETIARLGQYFFSKGREFEAEMEKQTEELEKEKIRFRSAEMFTTAAQVFGRLAPRFPNHALADKATALSGQCYMRATDYLRAVAAFKQVIDKPEGDKDLKAETMFWCGESYMKMKSPDYVNAYRMYKRLTWDYPASRWAKYARGRLTEDAFARVVEMDMKQ